MVMVDNWRDLEEYNADDVRLVLLFNTVERLDVSPFGIKPLS